PLREKDIEYYTSSAMGYRELTEQMKGSSIVPPSVTFESELTIDLGGKEAKILHLGKGNTAGDALVYLPDAKVVASGDLIVYPLPYSFGSSLSEWTQTLGRLKTLGANTIIPGHGPIMYDWSYVDKLVLLFKSTLAQVDAALEKKMTLEEVRKEVTLESFRGE